jgi:hypothetical protein
MEFNANTVAIAGIAVAVAGLWLAILKDRKITTESRNMRDGTVNSRLDRLDTKMETVWGAFNASLVGVLHHPDPAKIIPDRLLKKYLASLVAPNAITSPELMELARLMVAVAHNQSLQMPEREAVPPFLTLMRHHPLWEPTADDTAAINEIIGEDIHPKRLAPLDRRN